MKLTIKHADISDVKYFYDLANESSTRQNSFNSDKIKWEDHIQWYSDKINDNSTFLYVCMNKDIPVGIVRINIREEAIIGIVVDEHFRGMGIAAKIIVLGCKEFWKLKDEDIYAYIKKTNLASIKAFERANFRYKSDVIVNKVSSVKYIKKKQDEV